MWTSLLILASFVLLAVPHDFVPPYYPGINTLIQCMVPGPYEPRLKRFAVPPGRAPIPEPIFNLSLVPGNPDECWGLPPIVVKEPYGDIDVTRLDNFLNPTSQMRLITSNVVTGIVPMDPNDVFGLTRRQFEVPDSLLSDFDADEQNTIRRYAANFDFGQCSISFQVRERPAFYYPKFQVHGCCDARECSLPPTEDHDFNQRCRPVIGGDDQIYIRALRWDCCHSYKSEGSWEYICGWRMVRFPVVHKCECSCHPGDQ